MQAQLDVTWPVRGEKGEKAPMQRIWTVYVESCSASMTQLLRHLHCLRIPQRIQPVSVLWRTAVCTDGCHITRPQHCICILRRCLRSPAICVDVEADHFVDKWNRSTLADRAVPVAAAKARNLLSAAVRAVDSYLTIRRHLKRELFIVLYPRD